MAGSISVIGFGSRDSHKQVEQAMILVAEDHELVRMVVREILITQGYGVLLCRDGLEALRTITTYSGRLDLLLTEIALPGINGRQLSERGAALRSGLKTLYMSGYPASSLTGFGIGAVSYLPKPFTPEELLAQVECTLSSPFTGARYRFPNNSRILGVLRESCSSIEGVAHG